MSGRPKRLRVNLFEMACVGHIVHGLWRHPDDRRHRYASLAHWTGLAERCEQGGLDAIFLADVLGAYDVFGGGPADALAEAVQIPLLDPMLLIPAMAAATRRLGFAVTASTSYEPPFALARRMSTLDHLTGGRIGWNAVTSYLPNAARNFGHDGEIPHETRYAIAEESLEVLYKLWEGSWDDDAVRGDPDGPYTDPDRVRRISHRGARFQVEGPHLCEPSPQRTPLLFQAAASPQGMAFAGRHAEVLFVGGRTEAQVRGNIRAVRGAAAAAGRDPARLRFVVMAGIVTGPTDAQAEAKLEGYRRLYSETGALVHAQSEIDLRRHAPGETIAAVLAREGRTFGNMGRRFEPSQTVGEALSQIARFDEDRFFVCGGPSRVADAIETWLDVDGIDGINLRQYVSFETLDDFVERVMPELRRRGRLAEAGEGGTLRERYMGEGPRLPADHPAARWRDPSAFA